VFVQCPASALFREEELDQWENKRYGHIETLVGMTDGIFGHKMKKHFLALDKLVVYLG